MVILSTHVMYLPTSPSPLLGGSYQGDSCVLSTLNRPLTKHVGIGSQETSLNRVLHMANVHPIHCSVSFGRVQNAPRNNLLNLVHARMESNPPGNVAVSDQGPSFKSKGANAFSLKTTLNWKHINRDNNNVEILSQLSRQVTLDLPQRKWTANPN